MNINNYIRVFGDSLQNTNDTTKIIWEKSLKDSNDNIIDITREDSEEKEYLIKTDTYFELTKAARYTENKVDPYGIPNVNFTLIDESDDRWEKYQQQRLERGFDNSELWCLDSAICKFILPRLKQFKEYKIGHPCNLSEKEWNEVIDKMIKAFEVYDDDNDIDVKERNKIIDEGFQLFIDYFGHLWL